MITGTVTLNNVGYYNVSYGFTATANNRQFGLRLNGVTVTGSLIDSSTSIMQGVNAILQTTIPMSTLQLFNNSGANTTLNSSTVSSDTAYIRIEQIQ